jgi:hypothetical protein
MLTFRILGRCRWWFFLVLYLHQTPPRRDSVSQQSGRDTDSGGTIWLPSEKLVYSFCRSSCTHVFGVPDGTLCPFWKFFFVKLGLYYRIGYNQVLKVEDKGGRKEN